jgi:hypothetical protein
LAAPDWEKCVGDLFRANSEIETFVSAL